MALRFSERMEAERKFDNWRKGTSLGKGAVMARTPASVLVWLETEVEGQAVLRKMTEGLK